ncbi:FecCD family ABC transporter permease [Streptosporangium roseum]|uniref:FecCD family ABC transporter permease n=1 Tax=Streptosporangium roseum TaxID=2001 RepID=UPI003332355D
MSASTRNLLVMPAALATLAVVAGTHILATGLPFHVLAGVLDGVPEGLSEHVLWELGLPRLLTAMLTGAGLGVAGFLLQSALRNPLAAPEFTGVNPGAVLGILGGTTLGLFPADSVGGALVAALTGGALGGGLSWALASRRGPGQVIVAGLLGSAVLAGLTTMLLAYQPSRFGNAMRWLVGSVEGRVWDHLTFATWWILAWIALAWLGSAVLGVLAGGDEHAAALGLAPNLARALALAGAIALAAGAASLAGAVAFVGLVVPHVARWAVRGEPRTGIPAAALAGAIVLTGADALAQLLTGLLSGGAFAHRLGVPTGVVTALAGAAVLVAMARKERDV